MGGRVRTPEDSLRAKAAISLKHAHGDLLKLLVSDGPDYVDDPEAAGAINLADGLVSFGRVWPMDTPNMAMSYAKLHPLYPGEWGTFTVRPLTAREWEAIPYKKRLECTFLTIIYEWPEGPDYNPPPERPPLHIADVVPVKQLQAAIDTAFQAIESERALRFERDPWVLTPQTLPDALARSLAELIPMAEAANLNDGHPLGIVEGAKRALREWSALVNPTPPPPASSRGIGPPGTVFSGRG
jgi:hypothetical protein